MLISNVMDLIIHCPFPLFCYLRICFPLPSFFVVISACYYDKLNFVSSAAHQFTNRDISLMLGVSQRTVERRITQLQMSNMSRYSNIDDDMLDSFVQRIKQIFQGLVIGPYVSLLCVSLFLSYINPQDPT